MSPESPAFAGRFFATVPQVKLIICQRPRTEVLEKTPESSLTSKEIKPVNLKGGQP